jgi:multiple sugar transport system ATP-binding protein
VLVRVGERTFIVMVHGRASVGPGERVFLAPQALHAHLFDAGTGQRIGS